MAYKLHPLGKEHVSTTIHIHIHIHSIKNRRKGKRKKTATNTLSRLTVRSMRQTEPKPVFPAVRPKSESTNHLGASVATTSKTASKPIELFKVVQTGAKTPYIYVPDNFAATYIAYAELSTHIPTKHNPHSKELEKMVDKGGVTPIDLDNFLKVFAKSLCVKKGQQPTVYVSDTRRDTPKQIYDAKMKEIGEIAEQEVRKKEIITSSAVSKIEGCLNTIRMSTGQDIEFPVITDYKKEKEITEWNQKDARKWLSMHIDTQLASMGYKIDDRTKPQRTLENTITKQSKEIKELEKCKLRYSFNTGIREDEHQLAKYSRKIVHARNELLLSQNQLEQFKSEYCTLSNYRDYQQRLTTALKQTEDNTEKKINIYIENKAELEGDKAGLEGTTAYLTQQTKTTTAKSSSHQHDKLKDLRMMVLETASQEEQAKLVERELDMSLENSATRHQPPVVRIETLKCFALKTQRPLIYLGVVKSPMSKHFIESKPKEGTFKESVIYNNRLYVAQIEVEEYTPPTTDLLKAREITPKPRETKSEKDIEKLLESLPKTPPDGFGEISKDYSNSMIANIFNFLPDENISNIEYRSEFEDDPAKERVRFLYEKATIENKGKITLTVNITPLSQQ
ncbi:hypothetical protein [Vibrio aestuarianus]|uniref:Uncharacterized protein n=1 Tax=Vibrio aestuarianus TaxID=28171 RepID=A0ABD7YPD9_9VIBR|nr:hypothetical protein [Vibrio aestuarianus]WGK86701.1 hypothetical protein PYE67_17265 [Vibrio aestuarianus]